MGRTNNFKHEKVRDGIIVAVDFIQSLLFLGSIINAVMAPVIEKAKGVNFPECINKYADFFSTDSTKYVINCAIMLFFIIKLFVGIIRKNSKRNEEVIQVMDYLHKDYIHNMRSHMHHLEEVEDSIRDINISKKVKQYEKLYNAEYKKLECVAQQCVD